MGEKIKRRKHFISTLGTGAYTQGIYACEKGRCNTAYVQEASLKFGLNSQVDRITICLTDDAEVTNWIGRTDSDGQKEKGLKDILEEQYGKEKIETIKMSTGDSTEATDETFDRIYQSIQENEEIHFDITHGFRYFPMLVLTVLEYAKVTKNITVGGIYYGEFVRSKNGEPVDWPWYDLAYYSDILSWSNAADAFVRYGNSNQIKDLVSNLMRVSKKRKEYQSISNMVSALNNLTKCIETGRGKKSDNPQASIQKACEVYKERFENVKKEGKIRLKPLEVLMDHIDRKVNMLNDENNLSTGLSVVKWSIDNDMTQQGYTALEETIKTYVCDLAGVDDDKKWYRESFANALVKSIIHASSNDRKLGYDQWAKTEWDNDELKKIKEADESLEDFKSKIRLKGKKLSETIPEEIIRLESNISEKRNDINHFGFSNKTISNGTLKKDLNKIYEEFLKVIRENPIPEKICES